MHISGDSAQFAVILIVVFLAGSVCCYWLVNAGKKLEKAPEEQKKQKLARLAVAIGASLTLVGAWLGSRAVGDGCMEKKDVGAEAALRAWDRAKSLEEREDLAASIGSNAELQLRQGNVALAAALAAESVSLLQERLKHIPAKEDELKLVNALRLLSRVERQRGRVGEARRLALRAEAMERDLDR